MDTLHSLEEGEIRTDDESTEICNSKNNEEDEDDCVVIEPKVVQITIEDDNDIDDIPSSTDDLSNYQSLVYSFKERVSSTPYQNIKNDALAVENPKIDRKSPSTTLPFFVDICGRRSGFDSINSTDTFMEYSKLSTLREQPIIKRRSERLKKNRCSQVIDLDDSSQTNEQSLTLKRKSCEEDDSVIFVSETNEKDFIPIVDDTLPSHKKTKISETHNEPVSRQRLKNNSLFTLSEKKKLNEYNENAYNPSGDKTLTNSKRMVLIDGSNVAFKHALDQGFSVKGLKIAIEYFEKMGHEVKAVIPQFRMNKSKSSDPEELERLHKAGKIVQTPCKNLPGFTSSSYDDRFILQLAFELDAAIVSNDNYRDLLHENPALKKIIENRVIGYTWCNDIFILPKDPYGKWGPTLHTILNR